MNYADCAVTTSATAAVVTMAAHAADDIIGALVVAVAHIVIATSAAYAG